jgi:hypothetical protein
MGVRQFRLLVAGELTESRADVLFDRADDVCVEVLPPGPGQPDDPLPPGGPQPRGWDGLPVGVVAGPVAGPASGSVAGRVAWVAFDRVAPTLVDAVVSGVRDLDAAGIEIGLERAAGERTGPGLDTGGAIADDPLVTLETIGERIGRPVEVLRAWDLPAPVRSHPRRPVYDWPEVAEWLARRRAYAPPDDEATLEAVTLALRLRALGPRLERMDPLRSLLHR